MRLSWFTTLSALVLFSGCATTQYPTGARRTGVSQGPIEAPLPEAQPATTKDCPADISRDNAIEGSALPPPGTRVSSFGLDALWLPGNADQLPSLTEARVTLTLGELALVLGNRGQGTRALLLRPDEPGACVLAAWDTSLPGSVKLHKLQKWTSPDQQMAVFVLGLVHHMEGAPDENRWITLATDGRRVWAPLKGGNSAQLLVKQAKLRPQSGKLYLDVIVTGPGATVFAFRPESGQFEQLRQ